MAAFLGTAAACIFLVVSSLLRWHQPGAAYLLIGSLLYLFGTVLVTIVFNVPLNEALARVAALHCGGKGNMTASATSLTTRTCTIDTG